MKIYHAVPDNKNLFKNPVVTIGNFDGVHLGHKKIFTALLESARDNCGDAVVITFSSHPRKVLYPDNPIKIITTSEEKVNAIFNLGIDNIILLHFTREMAEMSAREFYNDILVTRIDARALVIGYDHAFGKNREGTVDYLSELCARTGMGLTRVDEAMLDSRPISSTWLRELIEQGDLAMTERILGRRYGLSGTVSRGQRRGRMLGFPTANIVLDDGDKVLPADGSYSVLVHAGDGVTRGGMLNIGVNPTFGTAKKTIEVNIFDFDADIYDARISVEFVDRIRAEWPFESVEALTAQLVRDRERALSQLSFRGLAAGTRK
jgi:riboflavin kinase/FMN adenylyltransferase